MKHIVVFSKGIEEDQAPIVRELIEKCQSVGIRVSFMKEVYDSVRRWMDLPASMTGIGASDLTGLKDIDFLFSLGKWPASFTMPPRWPPIPTAQVLQAFWERMAFQNRSQPTLLAIFSE